MRPRNRFLTHFVCQLQPELSFAFPIHMCVCVSLFNASYRFLLVLCETPTSPTFTQTLHFWCHIRVDRPWCWRGYGVWVLSPWKHTRMQNIPVSNFCTGVQCCKLSPLDVTWSRLIISPSLPPSLSVSLHINLTLLKAPYM